MLGTSTLTSTLQLSSSICSRLSMPGSVRARTSKSIRLSQTRSRGCGKTSVCVISIRFSSRLAPVSRGFRCRGDRLDDELVARAAAQVPRDSVPDLVLARIGVLAQQVVCGQHHAGSAEAALEPLVFYEGPLDRMQAVRARGTALDRH